MSAITRGAATRAKSATKSQFESLPNSPQSLSPVRIKDNATKVRMFIPRPRSNVAVEIDQVDSVTDATLLPHIHYLRPFLSSKVTSRILSTPPLADGAETLPSSLVRIENIPMLAQPGALKSVTMRSYQLVGLSWLCDRYHKGINCILADEMGLGKTLQTISLFAHLRFNRRLGGLCLVVAPLSVLFNWIAELRKFCPSLRVLRVHSNSVNAAELKQTLLHADKNYDVIVTTYEMLKTGGLQNILNRIYYRCVVLDEGHRIKNSESLMSKGCALLKARFKLILTGTPVQNNLHETYCLLHFLHPRVFDTSEGFDKSFYFNGAAAVVDKGALDNAHYMLRPFILRRVKSEVEQSLPPKLETMIRCPLSDMQRFWVKRLLLKDSRLLTALENADSSTEYTKSGADWRRLLSLLAQLRKAANHPFLFPGAETHVPGQPQATEEIVTASGKMMVLDRLLHKLLAKGHRVVLFSQFTTMLDIVSDYLVMRDWDFYRLDGSTHRVLREVHINLFNSNRTPEYPSLFLLSTRAGGEGVNLFTADTVILLDSDWNPQVDIQAMARVHRIGQTQPVHIYRLVSSGTVEERMVQRAQKKLFLDCAVNRGSTAHASALDDILAKKSPQPAQDPTQKKRARSSMHYYDDGKDEHESSVSGARGGDQDDREDVDVNSVLSSLKFGWNSCFGDASSAVPMLTDADVEVIIDRRRGLGDVAYDAMLEKKSSYFKSGVETTVAEFDSEVPLVSLREFEGEEFKKSNDNNCLSYREVGREWEEESTKRSRVSRFVDQYVEGVGIVKVLKLNQYSLTAGESSVFDVEGKTFDRKTFDCKFGNVSRYGQYENQDQCQRCWDGGDLLMCDFCPASYHFGCIEADSKPGSKGCLRGQFSCPHHRACNVCHKKKSFSFRCEACPAIFCEDCLPNEYLFLGEHSRWSCMGYSQPRNSCIIFCSDACMEFTNSYIAKIAAPVADRLRGNSNNRGPHSATVNNVSAIVSSSTTTAASQLSDRAPGSRSVYLSSSAVVSSAMTTTQLSHAISGAGSKAIHPVSNPAHSQSHAIASAPAGHITATSSNSRSVLAGTNPAATTGVGGRTVIDLTL